jgi:hypothetical protein
MVETNTMHGKSLVTLALLTERQPRRRALSFTLKGTTWTRTILHGSVARKQVYHFARDGVTYVSGNNVLKGTWKRDGNVVTMTFNDFVEIGTITDCRLKIIVGTDPGRGSKEAV